MISPAIIPISSVKKIPPIIKQTIKEMGNVMPNLSLRSSELKIVNIAKYNKKNVRVAIIVLIISGLTVSCLALK